MQKTSQLDIMKKSEMYSKITMLEKIVKFYGKENILSIITYNYPSLALKKIMDLCKKNDINDYFPPTTFVIFITLLIFFTPLHTNDISNCYKTN